ncbi:hypothetical protein EES39_39935 [Streptomyces sp. ADI92-24]|nr:hypothetical protein EES39_39935 [Streptomyces sp. ADI92-24]
MSCPAPDRDSRVDTAAWATMNTEAPDSLASSASEAWTASEQCTVCVAPR